MSERPPQRRPARMARVGHFFGVPVYFAPSWLLIAGLLTIWYAPIVRDVVPDVSDATSYAVAFVFAVLFALCVLAHELGHTAVALLLKQPVNRVVIFLLGGVSEIDREPERPRDEFLVAAAGPLVSIALAAAAFGGVLAVDTHTVLGVLIGLLFWSNLVVAVFNLLPGLPLDGGRLLRAAVWTVGKSRLTGTRTAAWAGRVVAVAVALAGLLADRTSWGLTAGFIGLLLAAYLWVGATQSLRVGEILDRLPRLDLHALLRPGLLVPSDLSVAEALRRAWSGNARGLVLVDSADRPAAIVDESQIGSVPPDRRPWTALSAVARPLEPGLLIPVGTSGQDLLDRVRATPAHEYLVVNTDGSPAGILAAADLATALQRPA